MKENIYNYSNSSQCERKTHTKLRLSLAILGFLFLFTFFFWIWNSFASEAESSSSTTSIKNNSNKELLTIDSSFYNYRYDNEILYGTRTQGSQSCYDSSVVPFGSFNNKLSSYYKSKSALTTGAYLGNFYGYVAGEPYHSWSSYSKFKSASNIANRKNLHAVVQGLVDSTLSSDGDLRQNGVNYPFFSKSFLATTSNSCPIGAVQENVGFPFRKAYSSDKGTYYTFNSRYDTISFSGKSGNAKDASYYFGSKGQLNYWYDSHQVYCKDGGSTAQFFPFNDAGAAQSALDYGFGVRLNIPFYLTEDGMQLENDGTKKVMKFSFEGDDDVWVFIDGKLVLDLGGDHASAYGNINFSGTANTAKTTINYVARLASNSNTTTANTHCFNSNNTTIKSNVTTTFAIEKDAEHVMTIFYMERGMFSSNMRIDFNFIPHDILEQEPANTPAPTATPSVTPAPYDGTLHVENKVLFHNVNSTFLTQVKTKAEDDIFQYSIKNKGTATSDVSSSGLLYPSGALSARWNNSKLSYFSFGTEPIARIFFDLATAKSKTSGAAGGAFSTTTGPYMHIWNASEYNTSGFPGVRMNQYNGSSIYYYDLPLGASFLFNNGKSGGTKTQSYNQTVSESLHGQRFTVTGYSDSGSTSYINGTWANKGDIENLTPIKKYSSGLPYQSPGPEYNFIPDDTKIANLQNVANTAFQRTDPYATYTNANILINSTTSTDKTNANGVFSLFYDETATFMKQFARKSTMQVIQHDTLHTPTRVSSPSTADDTVSFAASGTPRSASKYYFTSLAALDKDNTEVSIDTAKSFSYDNVSGTDDIVVTETFTNTIKTGNLYLYKNLKGSHNTTTPYTFQIKFSDVWANGSASTNYSGAYTLYTKSGDTYTSETKSTSTGSITLTSIQYAVIEGIPVGTQYEITETVTDGSIVDSINVSYSALEETCQPLEGEVTTTKSSRKVAGIIPTSVTTAQGDTLTDYEQVNVLLTFTNQLGVVSITKEISGVEEKDTRYDDVLYEFLVTYQEGGVTQNYIGDYILTTPTLVIKNPDEIIMNDSNTEIVMVETVCNTTDGVISLKKGQIATIGNLSLNGTQTYTVTENVNPYGHYELQSIKASNDDATITLTDATASLTLTTAAPNLEVTYTNHYYKNYIRIQKYIDHLYYNENEEMFAGQTYQALTKAEQTFIFRIEEHSTIDCNDAAPTVFYSTICFGPNSNHTKLTGSDIATKGSDSYYYTANEKIEVTAGKYYKITEDTAWSWKYTLSDLAATKKNASDVCTTLASKTGTNTSQWYIILSGDATGHIPTATFYNKKASNPNNIEGDTSTVINQITIEN